MPPITIAPTHITAEETESSPARKKTNSVSFSLDSSSDVDPNIMMMNTSSTTSIPGGDNNRDEMEKSESRKNKMLKRLSYPLSWMDTKSGDSKDDDGKSSQPHSADHQASSSVFSKVFSR